jgi:hypothetical protein
MLFWQGMLPLCWLWIAVSRWVFNCPTERTKNHGRSADAHFHDTGGSVLVWCLTLNAANTSFMNSCNKSPHKLPKMHNQKSLMLWWSSHSARGSNRVIYSFAQTGHQYVCNGKHRPRHHSITVYTRLKILDTLFTLILIYGRVKICCH